MLSCDKFIIWFMLLFFTVSFPMSEQQQFISLTTPSPASVSASASVPAPAPAPDGTIVRVLPKREVSASASVPAPAPAPAPSGTIERVLPKIEVDALNKLLGMSKYSVSFSEIKYLNTSCNSMKFGYSIECNCDIENSSYCRVTSLDMSNNELSGLIPNSTGDLVYLTSLDLSSNKLRGKIPGSFANLTRLISLDLSYNNLEGPIPGFLSNMTSLNYLYLRSNLFNESIPPELGSLSSLEYLSLRDNLLSGNIPFELGNLSSLVELYLYDNDLSGELSPHLGNLSNLETLHLMNNRFTGELPSTWSNLTKLQTFNVQGNNLYGSIPVFISNWKDLQTLMLMGNNFKGPLPLEISSLTSLTYLGINDLVGVASSFPVLKDAASLRVLTMRNCSLVGRIPDYIWRLPSLVYLDLSFNKFDGGIPAEVEKSRLQKIFLRRNNLNESLPGWMLNLSYYISFVDVSENFFTNTTLPNITASSDITNSSSSAIGIARNSNNNKRLINLFSCCSNITDVDNKWQQTDYYCANEKIRHDSLYINCGGNTTTINGSVYEADLYQEGGSTFYLSDNKAWGYSSMGVYLETYASKFIFNQSCVPMVDAPLYLNARVSPISLKYFGFCLKNDVYTVKLHFAEIGWQQTKGNLSTDIGGRVFNVDIQGERKLTDFNIEAEAGGLSMDVTKEYNVTINDTRLEIHLYWAGKGSILSPTTYYGPLISAISVSAVPKPHKKFPPAIIAAIVVVPLLIATLILALCWYFGLFGKKSNDGVEVFPGGVFNYQQIKSATNNFSIENKIGEGGFGPVYKGVLPPNGTPVAVKQQSKKSKQGSREFITELGIIYALRHPNLVRILGCCAEKDQLLLVYEYMENNSLEQALFAGPEKSLLSWETRVKICIDVAKGLAFLHHESKLNIIHGDIKSTNILLDKEFNAKISDFGYARTSEGDSSNTSAQPKEGEALGNSAKIKGTPGYMAPECMKAIFTRKADVYSYGIVVLEIVSGKKSLTPRSKGPTEYLLEKAYKYWTDNNLIALIDSRLIKFNNNEAKKLLNLAMACVSHDPIHRPTMTEVVKILEGKKKFQTVLVPVAIVDSTLSESDSIASGSTSQEIISDTMTSSSFSKETDPPGISPV